MPSVQSGQRLAGPENEAYFISDFLGRGAFGEVYRANGELTGAVIAVKLLPLGDLSDEFARRSLLNEIEAAAKINHPNVVRVLHVDEGSGVGLGPYVCMECVSGGTLARLLSVQNKAGAPIPLGRAIEMMIDIAQGMRAINEQLVHPDVKPDNILIENKTLKIGDFGISKFVDESTRLHTFKGGQHIAYMAPEAWVNDKNTYKLDVYAVGLVFHQILTLEHPFSAKVKDASNMQQWEKAHLYETCPDLRLQRAGLPMSLVQMISRMVAKRPQERPEWAEVLKILSDPAIEPSVSPHPAIIEAIESAVAKRQETEKKELEAAQKHREQERQMQLYVRSCDALLESLRPVVDQFNEQFQFGKIQVAEEYGTTFYRLPTTNVQVSFFAPNGNGLKLSRGVVVGGGWIGLAHGRSANLVLFREGLDDLYGRWAVCEIRLMALADPSKIIGRFGITGETVQPFGFKDFFFDDQIRYSQGGLHIFTYTFIENVVDYFAALIAEGCR